MSKIAAAAGNLDAALTAARKAVEVGPKNVRARLQLAALLKERGDLDGALTHLREARPSTRTIPTRGCCWAASSPRRGNLDEAASLVGSASSAEPQSAAAATQLGFVLAKQGRLEGGGRELQEGPGPRPRVRGGPRLPRLGPRHETEVDEASPTSRGAARQAGKRRAARPGSGWRCGKRKGGGGLAHFREAVRLEPGLAVAHYNLGRALKQGAAEEAVAEYRRALALEPGLAGAHNSLGSALGHPGPDR